MRGDKLVTTDQHSQLRVYEGPYYDLRQTISHPHRQFQHLTPVKVRYAVERCGSLWMGFNNVAELGIEPCSSGT